MPHHAPMQLRTAPRLIDVREVCDVVARRHLLLKYEYTVVNMCGTFCFNLFAAAYASSVKGLAFTNRTMDI